MKKVILVEILLAFICAVLLACAIKFLTYATDVSKTINVLDDLSSINASQRNELIARYESYISTALSYGIPALVAALCSLAAMIIIAIKDFPVFKPLVDKFKAKRAAHKQASDAAKAEKAEADKQARIEKLQAELEELKKDE